MTNAARRMFEAVIPADDGGGTPPPPPPGGGVGQGRFPGDPIQGTMYYGCSLGPQETIDSFESRVGFTSGVYREYYQADQLSAMISAAKTHIAKGRLPVFSMKVPPNGTIDQSWAAVANGSEDAWLHSIAQQVATLNGPFWFCMHHEPRGDGSQTNYRAMYKHAVPILHQASNLAVMPILNGASFDADDPAVGWFTPEVDLVGIDHYNQWWTYQTGTQDNLQGQPDSYHPWRSVQDNFGPIVDEVNTWGKASFFAEYGVHYAWNEPGKAANWVDAAFDYCLSRATVGMSYFNSAQNSPRGSWDMENYTVIPPLNGVYKPNAERFNAFKVNVKKPGNAHFSDLI
jgi:hypothetical protein